MSYAQVDAGTKKEFQTYVTLIPAAKLRTFKMLPLGKKLVAFNLIIDGGKATYYTHLNKRGGTDAQNCTKYLNNFKQIKKHKFPNG